MKFLLASLLALAGATDALAQGGQLTALGALKLLPKGEAKKLARIEAREGAPEPERWYVMTHDETSATGLHEYVVAGGELVASRTLSQFAESVAPEEVIGADAVRFDSDRAARLAQQYAAANGVTFAALHYALRKDGPEAAPLWTIICVDEAGGERGRLVISASKGTVISHDGFPLDPPAPKPRPKARTQIADTEREPEVRRPSVARPPGEAAEPRPGFFQRVGGSLQKVFTGREGER
jgi:hypothetical protein